MAQVSKWTVEYWIEPDALEQIETATYWNDLGAKPGEVPTGFVLLRAS